MPSLIMCDWRGALLSRALCKSPDLKGKSLNVPRIRKRKYPKMMSRLIYYIRCMRRTFNCHS